jgi:hypothetical protein
MTRRALSVLFVSATSLCRCSFSGEAGGDARGGGDRAVDSLDAVPGRTDLGEADSPALAMDGTSSDAGAIEDRDASPSADVAPPADASLPRDARAADAEPVDAASASCAAPAALSPGLAWVRSNPMMISGLAVVMGSPSPTAVSDYFDLFGATAVHLWATGLPNEIAGWSQAHHPGFRYVSWVQEDGTSLVNAQLLGGAPPLPGRIGYQIGDEPRDQAAVSTVLASAQTVRMVDPGALVIVNVNDDAAPLFPMITGSGAVDVLSHDHYGYGKDVYGAIAAVRAAALSGQKPYWRYLDAYYQKGQTPPQTESDLRWDAFLGAVFGFTGNTWFIYDIEPTNPDLAPLLFASPGDYAADKTPFYGTVGELNQKLARIGRTLVLLRSVDVRYVPAISFIVPSGMSVYQPGAGGDPYLRSVTGVPVLLNDAAIGFFRDDCDEPYLMIQNAGHAGGSFPNATTRTTTFRLELDFSSSSDPSLDRTAVWALDLDTGVPTARPLTATGPATATADVDLPPGDLLFFKYKNTHPFVQQ